MSQVEPKALSSGPQAPRVALLGFCDRSQQLEGEAGLNVLGLSVVKASYIYPLNLHGQTILLAVYFPRDGEKFTLRFRPSEPRHQFDLTVTLNVHVSRLDGGPIEEIMSGDRPITFPGWRLFPVSIGVDLLAFEPDNYQIFLVSSSGEVSLGSVSLAHASIPPFTPEDFAAIKSDALGLKWARFAISCKECGEGLQAYTGIERDQKAEGEGWVWYEDLPDRFICKCGTHNFSLLSLRTTFHGVLRRNLSSALRPSISTTTALYEVSSVERACNEFLRLIGSDPKEEKVQVFMETHPIFFSRFSAQKLKPKPPILTYYVADFFALTARKELFLIEIEKPTLKLLKKDGGITSDLQHAIDQVRRWRQVVDDHREAALEAMGLTRKEVAKVRCVVIAGRTPKGHVHERSLRAACWDDIDVFTYDDIIGSVANIIREVVNT